MALPYGIGIRAGADGNLWAIREVSYNCVLGCIIDTSPPVAVMRLDLVHPEPRITSVARAFDGVVVRSLGFVPDTVIRFDGADQTTMYLSPFDVLVNSPDVLRGGALVAVNRAPGGGASAAFDLEPESIVRRRAAR